MGRLSSSDERANLTIILERKIRIEKIYNFGRLIITLKTSEIQP